MCVCVCVYIYIYMTRYAYPDINYSREFVYSSNYNVGLSNWVVRS